MDIKLPLLLTIPFPLISLFVALTFSEPESVKKKEKTPVKLSMVIHTLKTKPKVLLYSFFYGIIRAVVITCFVGFLPLYFFVEVNLQLFLFGIILGLFTLVSLLAAKNAKKIISKIGENIVIIIMVICLVSAFIILGFFRRYIVLGIILPPLLAVSAGLIRPLSL